MTFLVMPGLVGGSLRVTAGGYYPPIRDRRHVAQFGAELFNVRDEGSYALPTPAGDAPEQMFPMPGSCFFTKYFLILFAQTGESRPAQALDFHPKEFRSIAV